MTVREKLAHLERAREESRRRASPHESGHVWANFLLGARVIDVSIATYETRSRTRADVAGLDLVDVLTSMPLAAPHWQRSAGQIPAAIWRTTSFASEPSPAVSLAVALRTRNLLMRSLRLGVSRQQFWSASTERRSCRSAKSFLHETAWLAPIFRRRSPPRFACRPPTVPPKLPGTWSGVQRRRGSRASTRAAIRSNAFSGRHQFTRRRRRVPCRRRRPSSPPPAAVRSSGGRRAYSREPLAALATASR
jgi:hypothetical protein